MAVRLKDIADKAGVSLTTVAHVMNGYTKSGIKPETWQRVQKIADELGYRPNAIARSLRFQKTHTIGVYTGYEYRSMRDPFLAEVYTGIQKACDELGYDYLVRSDMHGKSLAEIRLRLGDGKIDGIVIHAPAHDPVVDYVVERKLPAIAIADRQPHLPSMVADDFLGMELLVDYLWDRGHRDIWYLTSVMRLESIIARSEKFEALMLARGGRSKVVPYPVDDPAGFLKELMHRDDRPTAICCWNDYYAYELLKHCLRDGVRIPDELAVVGFDGLLETRLPARELVTVSAPWETMACDAVKLLVKSLDGEPAPATTVVPVTLISGDTA